MKRCQERTIPHEQKMQYAIKRLNFASKTFLSKQEELYEKYANVAYTKELERLDVLWQQNKDTEYPVNE